MVGHLTPRGITVSDRHPPHPECQMEDSQLSNFQVFDPTYYDAVLCVESGGDKDEEGVVSISRNGSTS